MGGRVYGCIRVDTGPGYRQPGEAGGGHDRGGREGGCLRDTMNAVRRAAERGASEVVLLHSLAGGSGSGLGSRLLEHLRDAYGKRYILAASVAPRPDGDTPLQHYNSALAAQFLHAYADGVLLFQVRTHSLLLLLLLCRTPLAAHARFRRSAANVWSGAVTARCRLPWFTIGTRVVCAVSRVASST